MEKPMQRIPTVYGFSIIVLVIILMILNHFIYIAILERTEAKEVVPGGVAAEQVE